MCLPKKAEIEISEIIETVTQMKRDAGAKSVPQI